MKFTDLIYPLAFIALSAVSAQDIFDDEDLVARDPLSIKWNPTFGTVGDRLLGNPDNVKPKGDDSGADNDNNDDDDDADNDDKKSKKKSKKKGSKKKSKKAKKPEILRREALEELLYERDLLYWDDDFE